MSAFHGHVNFFRFTQLPPEVQSMIWKFAVDALKPRMIDINTTSETSWITGAPEPALLHICAESCKRLLR